MNIKSTRERLLASTMIVGAFALAAAGQAAAQAVPTAASQTAQPAFGPAAANPLPATGATGAASNSVQEVVVTGSRIPQPNLSATSPVTAVSSAEIKLEGATDAVNVLSELPEVNGNGSLNNTPNPLSSSGGFATVNLRGLGNVRTLVLQDGRRLQPGDPTLGGEAADIDTVPVQLIDRVEVLTGGASAVYGSDAVAGVVNFIMKHDFQGVQLDIQGGFDQNDNRSALLQRATSAAGEPFPNGGVYDGENFIASAIFGANAPDGKGNVTAYLNYRHQDPVSQGNRDFSACALSSTPACSNSSNSNFFQDNLAGAVYSECGTAPNNIFVPYGSGACPTKLSPPSTFNSSPYEYLSRGDERYQGGFFANYQVKPWADIYSEFSFTDDRSRINAGPTAAFRGPAYAVNCDNPLLSTQEVATICGANGLGAGDFASLTLGRRNIEGGAREYSYEHASYRGIVGARGDLAEGWHYDAYAQYGYTKYNYQEQDDFSYSKINKALDVVNGPGGPTCASVLDGTDPACVPYNIFSQGGVSKAALNYINEGTLQTGFTQEQIVSGNITGDLGQYGAKSPFATKGIGVSLGSEYRREQLDFTPDAASQSGDITGAGTSFPKVDGQFDVYELFGEIRVPIVQDLPFVKDFTFDGAYRFSQYSTAGITNTYKFGLEYAPVRDIRFRGSFERAVRAPNTNELFSPTSVTNGSYADPCAYDPVNKTLPTATLAQCLLTFPQTAAGQAQGRALYRPDATDKIIQCASDQCGVSLGGNTNLSPERSSTTSFGFVATPRFIKNFDVSVDYYRIDVDGAISVISPDITVNQCINAGDPVYCNLIHRSANNGELESTTGFVTQTNINAGTLKTSGIDFEANYRFNLADLGYGDFGRLAFNYVGNYTQHFINVPAPGLGSYDCAGYYGTTCGLVPRFTNKLRATYTSPWKWSISGQWRYTGSVRLDSNQPNPLITSGSFDQFDAKIPSVSYFDTTILVPVKDGLTLRAGVSNILDRNPPIIAGNEVAPTGSPNTFPNYDLLGRQVFVGLTADF